MASKIIISKNKNQTIIPSNNMNLLKEHSTDTLSRLNENLEIGAAQFVDNSQNSIFTILDSAKSRSNYD